MVTLHRAPWAASMGVAAPSQSLKSPTSATEPAPGARTTNWTVLGPGTGAARWGERTPSHSASPASAAAANPASGLTAMSRGREIHSHASPSQLNRPGRVTTRASTAASSVGSISTGWRRWSITRCSTSSSRSNTLDLAQQGPQLLTGAQHAHLQGGHADAGEPGHFCVLHILHVLQQESLPQWAGQSLHRQPNRIFPLGRVRRCGRARLFERDVIAHEHAVAPGAAPAGGAASVYEDPEQPATELPVFPAAVQGAVRPHESILQRLLGIVPIAEHVHGIAAKPVAVTRDQHGEGGRVTFSNPGYQVGVARHRCIYPGIRRSGHPAGL